MRTPRGVAPVTAADDEKPAEAASSKRNPFEQSRIFSMTDSFRRSRNSLLDARATLVYKHGATITMVAVLTVVVVLWLFFFGQANEAAVHGSQRGLYAAWAQLKSSFFGQACTACMHACKHVQDERSGWGRAERHHVLHQRVDAPLAGLRVGGLVT